METDMIAATYQSFADSFSTTDSAERGCSFPDLADLTSELTQALNGALLTFLLCAELEDAFDTALFRASRDETPAFAGGGLFAIS